MLVDFFKKHPRYLDYVIKRSIIVNIYTVTKFHRPLATDNIQS